MPTLVPRPDGRGALLTGGVPGHKGAGGRPPNWLKDWCDDQLADPKSKESVLAILHDADHSAFATMWKAVAERAHGKPAQPIEVSGELEHLHGVIEVPPKLSPDQWRQRYKQTA